MSSRLVPITLLLVVVTASCTPTAPTPSPAANYGAECAAFGPDPSDEFFTPTDVSYEDPTVLDWSTAQPADVGLDEALLSTAADNAALSHEIQSMLVVRHGKLVFERYFNGSSATEANNVASVSKSILSVLTGIAIKEGLLRLDSRIDEYLPADLVGTHGSLTIENLLTMSAGLALSSDAEYLYDVVIPNDEPGEPSFVRAVLQRESVAPAGSEFAYSTGLTQVLAAVLTNATGQSLCAYAASRLLGPLGIDVEKWWVEPDGYFAGGHSVFITPREIARFGQLALQHGQWQDKQLVPAEWLDKSLTERWDLGCKFIRPAHQGYGYLWWLYNVDGYEVWNASGYGDQELWIAPALDLLVVITHDAATVGAPDRHEVGTGAFVRAAILSQFDNPPTPKCLSNELRGYTVPAGGGNRALVPGWSNSALPGGWSSDGSRIVVSGDLGDLNSEIYVLNQDGTTDRRLTYDLAFESMPALSPDGASVAFLRGAPAQSDLYLVNIDGTNLQQITDYDGFEHSPTWSPDGTRIAFIANQGDVNGYGEGGPLWTIRRDGSDRSMLLDRTVGYPAWSPDGEQIALELRETMHIGVLDIASGSLADLGQGYVPKWSPDGTQIAFIADRGTGFDVYVMDADGENVIQVTNDPAFDTLPIWSPDGRELLFLSNATWKITP